VATNDVATDCTTHAGQGAKVAVPKIVDEESKKNKNHGESVITSPYQLSYLYHCDVKTRHPLTACKPVLAWGLRVSSIDLGGECLITSEDTAVRASLEQKLQLVRDRVQSVADGYANGLYLWGEGGLSKSYTVQHTLNELRKPYKLSNSRLTAKGLFELLRDHPDLVHVIEDAEPLLAAKHASGVLRSALWGQDGPDGRQERPVVWQIAGTRVEVLFTGGIILVCNAPLENLPELRALRTRIPILQYGPTTAEIILMMRDIASKGHRHGPHELTPTECLEVAHQLIARFQQLQRTPDIRLMINAFKDRLQWANGASTMHWIDLLDSRLKERTTTATNHYLSRSARTEQEQEIARRTMHLAPQERLQVWKHETGKSQPALYRRLQEVQSLSHISRFSQSALSHQRNPWQGNEPDPDALR
jgi:hypothetical protein